MTIECKIYKILQGRYAIHAKTHALYRYFGHAITMDKNRLLKLAKYVHGKRSGSRPKKRWFDVIRDVYKTRAYTSTRSWKNRSEQRQV